ncbi:MAG: lipoate--protein ligase [Clostridia bacterium]|nr:lipoate--protein ligase [Clostridia bacterium]
MIYLESDSLNAHWNLALEYYLATEKKIGDTIVYLWRTSPTVVIGKFQNALEELDRQYTEEKGIRIARRMSGGGTIYNDEGGLMFTYIVPENKPEIDFRSFINPVIAALGEMGVSAEASGRNDILVDGKKVSGNAQYKIDGMTVHHGTLMFDVDIGEVLRATTPKPYKITSKSIQSVRERVTNIREHLPAGEDMTREQFKNRLAASLAGNSPRLVLHDADLAAVDRIEKECFSHNVWEAQPRFSLEKVLHLPGGHMEFSLETRQNRILDARVHGDFFGSVDAAEICALLKDVPLEAGAIAAALAPLAGRLMGITPEEIAAGLTS